MEKEKTMILIIYLLNSISLIYFPFNTILPRINIIVIIPAMVSCLNTFPY